MRRSLVVLLLLASCGENSRSLTWNYRFAGDPASVEARVREGGCDGTVIFEDRFRADGSGMTPPDLGRGEYGFEIVLRDASCQVIGRGCLSAQLPLSEDAIVVAVEPVLEPACMGCDEGLCTGAVRDAGIDAADTDVPRDAAESDGGDPCGACECAGDRCVDGTCIPQTPATSVHTAQFHSCALAGDRLFCWGRSSVGELGTGGFDDASVEPAQILGAGWERVSTGLRSTCGVRRGETLCWGSNNSAQLGLGDGAAENVFGPLAQPADRAFSSLAIALSGGLGVDEGVLYGWGTNANFMLGADIPRNEVRTEPIVFPGISRVASVHAWQWTSAVVRTDGELLTFGWNADGELGAGSSGNSLPGPISLGTGWSEADVGIRHTCATQTDGTLWCWGKGRGTSDARFTGCERKTGALGIGDVDATTPERVDGVTGVQAIATGCSTCAIDAEGALFCFGPNESGELGLGDQEPRTTPTEVAPGTRWIEVDQALVQTCAIREGGAVYCWGTNARLVLGSAAVAEDAVALRPERVCLP
ncbi:MAG: hypothetical protein AAGE52_32560 [Myxococcota bacterium]